MSTIRIGIVDLDNSHPAAFAPILQRTEGLHVSAVYDHGDVQPATFVQQFAAENGIERVCESLEELVATVDVGMVHSQNWDRHLERVRPFLEAGKPVFLDKPAVGRRRDAQNLLEAAARTNTPIMGGSALRYADEIVELRQRRAELGHIFSAFVCGPGDFFNIGSHITALAAGFFGAEAEAATWIGPEGEDLFLIEQRDEPPLVLQLSAGSGTHARSTAVNATGSRDPVGSGTHASSTAVNATGIAYGGSPAYMALATEHGMHVVAPKSGGVGAAIMREFARFCRTGQACVPFAEVLGDALVLLMSAEARRTGRRVTAEDVPLDAGFDGAAFTEEFASSGGYKGHGLTAAHALYVAG